MITRRALTLITGPALVLAAPAIVRSAHGAASITIPTFTVAPGTSGFPGQAGNPVGYTAAASGYRGSLTPATTAQLAGTFPSGTAGSPTIIQGVDFNFGTQNNGNLAAVTLGSGNNYIKFVGCRFQSNNLGFGVAGGGYIFYLNACTNITFSYCSFVPLASLYTAPPGAAWPSASAGLNTHTQTQNINCTASGSGYEYAMLIGNSSNALDNATGPITVDHCDLWGGGSGIAILSTTKQMTISNTWIHDMTFANFTNGGTGFTYHQDCMGYLNGATGPTNVLVQGNTIASLGNTNCVAWQNTNGAGYSNIQMMGNYITGCGYTIWLPGVGGSTSNGGNTFINNVLGTDIQASFGPFYEGFNNTPNYTPAQWNGNTVNIVPGTSQASGSSWAFAFTSANNGKFMLPTGSVSTTDY
jgi:hypothetical protein